MPFDPPDYLDFGPFRLDLRDKQLLRHATPVPLTPKMFELLVLLASNAGSLVRKGQIVDHVWPNTHVVDSNLGFNLSVVRKVLGDTARQPRYIQTVARLGYRFIADVREVRSGERPKSLVVLPFVSLHPESEDDHVSSGVSDALSSELAQFQSLRVISRASARAGKASAKSLPEMARLLRVDAVIEGSIVRDDEKMSLAIRLIEPETAHMVWAQKYEGSFKDLLSMISTAALAIAGQLNVRPTGPHAERVAARREPNPDAHELYLRGLHHFHQFFTATGMTSASRCFRAALAIQPDHAQAWAMLSACHSAMAVQSMTRASDAWEEARAAAEKGLEIDPDLPETQVAAAAVELFFGWDWHAFEEKLSKARELGPNYSGIYSLATIYAALRGRGEQAIAYAKRAIDLDPLSALMHVDLGWAYLLAGKHDDAEEQCRTALSMGFAFPLAHLYLGQIHLCRKEFEPALREFRKLVPPSGYADAPAPALAMLGYGLASAGYRTEAFEVSRTLERRVCYVSPYDLAIASLGVGLTDRAVELLEQAYCDRSPRVTRINVEPWFAPIRSERSFRKLVRLMKLD